PILGRGCGSLGSPRAPGHVTRPRMHFCQTISWIHLCLILYRFIKLIDEILIRSSRRQPDKSSARARDATRKGALTAFRPCIRGHRERYTANAHASRSTRPVGLIVCSRGLMSSRRWQWLAPRDRVGSIGTRIG